MRTIALVGTVVLVACTVNVGTPTPPPAAGATSHPNPPASSAPPTPDPLPRPVDAGSSVDAAPETGTPPQVVDYVAVCVTSLAARDPNQALRFYGSKNGDSWSLTPLKGWDATTSQPITPSVDPSNEVGSTYTVTPAGGSLSLVTISIPAAANSVSGRDATIANFLLSGTFSGDHFCTTFGGTMTVPYSFTFNPSLNTCMFQRITANGNPVPAYVCP